MTILFTLALAALVAAVLEMERYEISIRSPQAAVGAVFAALVVAVAAATIGGLAR